MSPYRTAWIPPPAPRPPWVVRAYPVVVRALSCFVAAFSFFVAAALTTETLEGCKASSAQPSATQEAGLAAYAAEQEACITAAKTLADSQACRLAVRQKWGRK
jgi:hypothetical protein